MYKYEITTGIELSKYMLIKYLFICGNLGGPWQLRALVRCTPYTHLGTALVIYSYTYANASRV